MKNIICCFFIIISFSVSSQVITRNYAYELLKKDVLGLQWSNKKILASKNILAGETVIYTNDSFVVSHTDSSWFFFVDEYPMADWWHPCKYVFISTIDGSSLIISMFSPPYYDSLELLNLINPIKTVSENDFFNIQRKRNIQTTSNEYAIIISGGCEQLQNFSRYYNHCKAIYQTLVNVYNYDKDHIYVIMSDGTNPTPDFNAGTYYNNIPVSYSLDLDNDGINDVQYSATKSDISTVFSNLQQRITSNDNIFVFVTDHGGNNSTICLWNKVEMTTQEFSQEINKINIAKTINICMVQCFSGGYTTTLAGPNRVITTSCSASELAYTRPQTNNLYGEFCYHWLSAVLGQTPDACTSVNADFNEDGYVSMEEAFQYAKNNDQWYISSLQSSPEPSPSYFETPQYYSNCYCLGESLALNGIFDSTCFDKDLYVRDTVTDNGTTPSTVHYAYNSPDIWTTDMEDNPCNPTGGEYCKVCVRVHNKSNYPSSGNEKLIVNWAKAGMGLSWNYGWLGNNCFAPGLPGSGYVTDAAGIAIPSIPAGGSTVIEITWLAPDPSDYASLLPIEEGDWWHFCLAARVHDGTPITGENSSFLNMGTFTRNNDNVAWKNISIISEGSYNACVAVSNLPEGPQNLSLNLVETTNGSSQGITNYAEVYITLDAGLLTAINSANISGLTWVNSSTLRWNGGSACIPMSLPANSNHLLKTTVHFLADQVTTDNDTFGFDIVLRDPNAENLLGGEHFRCIRTGNRYFQAVANNGSDDIYGSPAELTAEDINEPADYRWFDDQGVEVGSGTSCYVNPQQTTTYTLRVTAEEDGYRTYDQVTVNVPMMRICSVSPNPAEGQARVSYELSRSVSTATLQILNGSGQEVYSQALSGGNGSKVTGETLVNTSSLSAGSYTVRLVSNRGNIFDSKTLVIR